MLVIWIRWRCRSRENITKWAILDSGATSNFLMTDAHATHFDAIAKSIRVTLPDGSQISSTHQCLFDLLNLLHDARKAYVIPGLASHSLILIVTLCNAGCKITFIKIGVTVRYRGRTIMKGKKCTRTGLWMVSLQQPSPAPEACPPAPQQVPT